MAEMSGGQGAEDAAARIAAGRIKHGVGASEDFAGNVCHLVSPIVGTLRLRQRDGSDLPDIGWVIDRLSLVLDMAREEAERETPPHPARCDRGGAMSLPDEKREAVCLALAEQHGCVVEAEDTGRLLTCRGCAEQADALAPLLAGWLADARAAGKVETVRPVLDVAEEAELRGYDRGLAEGEARLRARVEAILSGWGPSVAKADVRAALDADAAETTGGGA